MHLGGEKYWDSKVSCPRTQPFLEPYWLKQHQHFKSDYLLKTRFLHLSSSSCRIVFVLFNSFLTVLISAKIYEEETEILESFSTDHSGQKAMQDLPAKGHPWEQKYRCSLVFGFDFLMGDLHLLRGQGFAALSRMKLMLVALVEWSQQHDTVPPYCSYMSLPSGTAVKPKIEILKLAHWIDRARRMIQHWLPLSPRQASLL